MRGLLNRDDAHRVAVVVHVVSQQRIEREAQRHVLDGKQLVRLGVRKLRHGGDVDDDDGGLERYRALLVRRRVADRERAVEVFRRRDVDPLR